jgi:predicted PhzF superfamily epimerase YddE/YHI9
MKKYRFIQVDVFTDKPFGGNPLAVFPEAEGLTTGDMQKIAREMNLSETTFVLPPQAPEAAVHVRVFAPHLGVPEDPATGSANGALGAYLVHHRDAGRRRRGAILRKQEKPIGRIHLWIRGIVLKWWISRRPFLSSKKRDRTWREPSSGGSSMA